MCPVLTLCIIIVVVENCSACTRSEILDYTNRVSKYGQEIADKKRPNAFTFEIWEFMQSAKRSSCRSDMVQAANGATTNHGSTDENASQAYVNGNDTQTISEDDDDDDDVDDELFNWLVLQKHFDFTRA